MPCSPQKVQPCAPLVPAPETQTGRGGQKEYLDAEDGLHRLTDRPTYDQRRAQQIADGAEPIKKKCRAAGELGKTKIKKCTCKIKIVWTTCKGLGAHSACRGDSFPDRQGAEAAAAEYKACHGWTPFAALCEPCSAFHLYHSTPPKKPSGDHRNLVPPSGARQQWNHLEGKLWNAVCTKGPSECTLDIQK